MSDEWTEADAVIEEVWEIRRQIWARFDNDPEKVIAYYLDLEKQQDGRKVETQPPGETGKSAA